MAANNNSAGKDGVVQYLGVQYATLEHKFANAQIREYESIDSMDGKSHGPSAVSAPNACGYEFGLIQKSLPIPEFPHSDIDCLHLNITAPEGAATKYSGLPVFAFIHGGGFAIGSNAWPQYDQARIVKLSCDLGMPVIGVGINYRLGPFGFMTSNELRNHGYNANNGLKDQQLAFSWIQKHVELFGGDPSRVTCIGESAGAASTMFQVELKAPFQQLISMSGTPLMMKPLPPVVADNIYQTVIGVLGLRDLPVAERISALSSMSSSEILSKLPPGLPFLAVLDGAVLQENVSFEKLRDSCKSSQKKLLIGSCGMDASVFGVMLSSKKKGCLERFTSILNDVSPHHATKVLEAYDLRSDMSDEDAWPKILDFANHIGFQAPARAYASAWPTDSYQYRFNEPNPWDGPWKGHATHVLDVAYLFLNYTEHLTSSQAELARQFTGDIIKFVNGKAPFQQFNEEFKFMKEYISKDGEGLLKQGQGDDDAHWQALFSSVGYDTLSGVWARFMGA